MRFYFGLLPLALCLAQEQSFTTYVYDLNGRRVPVGGGSAGGGARSETLQTINGRQAPAESSEERVISEGPGGKVVERILKKFDPSGRLSGTEKVLIEETRNADGSTSSTSTTWDSDLNGRFALRERSQTEVRKQGDTTHTSTVTERPNVNGAMSPEEKRSVVTVADKQQSRSEVVVYRKSGTGPFAEFAREIAETRTAGDSATTTTTRYNTAAAGVMELVDQRVSRTGKQPGGAVLEVVDVFGAAAPGRAAGAGPKLREQQIIERKGGLETFSVRRVELDSGRLGPAVKVSEKSCSPSCNP